MGWIDAVFGVRSQDPFKDLDPRLREYLQKESPLKPGERRAPPSPPPPLPTATDGPASATSPRKHGEATDADQPKAPPQSLFPDGRYAHIWKTYRPLGEIEHETKSDHEHLTDVLDAFKERKSQIGRAAAENCAIEQEAWMNCTANGTWMERMKSCREPVRRFERCYKTQARLLKALGYASMRGRPDEVEDDIQMRADALYQRMAEHETAVEKAREEGRPPPVFDPRIRQQQDQAHKRQYGDDSAMVEPNEELRKKWDAALGKLPESERAVEEAALRADLQVKAHLGKQVLQMKRGEAAKEGGGAGAEAPPGQEAKEEQKKTGRSGWW